MEAAFSEWLTLHSSSPFWVFLGIVVLSYLLEDVAIVTAAGLASQQLTPMPFALLAIFIGIACALLPWALQPLFSRHALPIIDQSIFSTGPSPLISQTFH